MKNEEIIKFLTTHKDYLDIAGLLSNILREIGFGIIKLLVNLWDLLAGSQSKVLDLLDFTSYPKIGKFIQDFQPYGIAISAICVVGLGFLVMRDKESDMQKILTNIGVATVLFIATPLFITNLNLITKGVSNEVLNTSKPATEVFQQNVVDLYKVDEDNWEGDYGETTTIVNAPGQDNETEYSGKYPNYFGMGDESYLTMNITEVMAVGEWNLFKDADDFKLSDTAEKALKYKISYVKGKPKLYKLENKWLNVDEAYYRYSWHPWVIFFTVLSGLVVSVFLIWRLVHLEMELGFGGIWAQLTSFTDLHSGKRNIQLIQTIVNCSVVIIAIFVLQHINTIAWLFIDTLDWGLPLKVLVKIAVSAFVVSGPNVIEQMFGIDGGTRGFMQSLTGAAMGLNSMLGLGRSAKNTAKSVGKTGVKAATAAGKGAAHGATSLFGAASSGAQSVLQKGQEMATKSANKNRNQRADSYENKGTGSQHATGEQSNQDNESRLSKHSRSNTKSGSPISSPSIFGGKGQNNGSGKGNGTTRNPGNKPGTTGSVLGNRGSRNVLGERTHSAQLSNAMQQQSTQSPYTPVTNARKQLATSGNNAQSVFPKANFSTRTMRRNQARLNDALQSKRPFNQSRSQLKEFAKQNKEILRSGRG